MTGRVSAIDVRETRGLLHQRNYLHKYDLNRIENSLKQLRVDARVYRKTKTRRVKGE
jgi:hypothetical protein